MAGEIVDDVRSGRRFPYSRAFAQAGFSADDAERWRRAGWEDVSTATPWHRIDTAADAVDLFALAADGFEAEQVAAVARFAPDLTVAWTRALLGRRAARELDLRDRHEIDLRPEIRGNELQQNHPIGP